MNNQTIYKCKHTVLYLFQDSGLASKDYYSKCSFNSSLDNYLMTLTIGQALRKKEKEGKFQAQAGRNQGRLMEERNPAET